MNVPFERFGGGANRSNRALALGLARRGHDVHVVCPATDPTGAPHRLLERLASEGMIVARDADAIR